MHQPVSFPADITSHFSPFWLNDLDGWPYFTLNWYPEYGTQPLAPALDSLRLINAFMSHTLELTIIPATWKICQDGNRAGYTNFIAVDVTTAEPREK